MPCSMLFSPITNKASPFSHIVCIYFISGCKLCTLLQHGIQIYESRLLCFLGKIGHALALRLAV